MAAAGIVAFGGYVPLLRIPRATIADAMAWANPALKSRASGERAFCDWDEDSITMAVEASRSCLAGRDPTAISNFALASTTLPFADRDNAVVAATALGLADTTRCQDLTASQRAATTMLAALAESATDQSMSLLTAAERRIARPASEAEMAYGHGAASLLIGCADVAAEFIGACSLNSDLVDHYRASGETFDYNFEQRWIRDEGFLKLVPRAVQDLLDRTGIEAGNVDHFVAPCPAPLARKLAAIIGIASDAVADDLSSRCGHTGAAQPLLALCHTLDGADPGQLLLVIGFGQGVDALLFRTTERVNEAGGAVSAALARRREESQYNRFLSFCGILPTDWGHRAEHDKRTAMTVAYRKRDAITGFVGGKCGSCGTVQFPRTIVCVNPDCRESHTQDPARFADRPAKVKSFTEDWLGFSPDPPAIYGNVAFVGGANILMEFADVRPGELAVGLPVTMRFRIKDVDERRHFRRYFWKPAPLDGRH